MNFERELDKQTARDYQKEPRCPYIKSIRVGDETMDYCELTERPSGRIKYCLSGECEEWNRIQEEEK